MMKSMGILPVINAADIDGVKARLATIKNFLPEDSFIHLDVADASMTFNKTWNDAGAWPSLGVPYQLEVHLMVDHPERSLAPWIAAGARRFIIHVETITDETLDDIFNQCSAKGVGVALSSNPETPVDRLATYLKRFSMFQILAVHPGLAGQAFLPMILEKLQWLRREYPHAIIEVDGGMNADTVRLVKDAGADLAVSSHYLFEDGDPAIAYNILTSI